MIESLLLISKFDFDHGFASVNRELRLRLRETHDQGFYKLFFLFVFEGISAKITRNP